MPSAVADSQLAINPTPAARFGIGATSQLPGIVRGTGCAAAVIVTDAALAATPAVARVAEALAGAGIAVSTFAGVHPNPTTGDIAAGAAAVADAAAEYGRVWLVAVGGGSPIDAAKGIALAAVNPQRGRVGMTHAMADVGISAADFDQIAADALDDEVLANTPRRPDTADIRSILLAARK